MVEAPAVEGPVLEAPLVEAPAIPAPADPPAPEVRSVAPLRGAHLAVVETLPAASSGGLGTVPEYSSGDAEPLPEAPAATGEAEPPPARPARRAPRRAAVPQLDGETPFAPWTPKGGLERKALDSLDDREPPAPSGGC